MKKWTALFLAASMTFFFAACQASGHIPQQETQPKAEMAIGDELSYQTFGTLEELIDYSVKRNAPDSVAQKSESFVPLKVCALPQKALEGMELKGITVLENIYIMAGYTVNSGVKTETKDPNWQDYAGERANSAIYKMTMVSDEFHDAKLESKKKNGAMLLEGAKFEDKDVPIYYWNEYGEPGSDVLIGYEFVYYLPGMEIYVHLPAIALIEEMLPYANVELVPLEN